MTRDLRAYATSSAFVCSARYMRRGADKPKVYLYVEDDLDKVFWKKMFESYSDLYEFEISVYKKPTGEYISGKDYMLKCVKNNTLCLNRYVMCCVDADYDLIVDISGKYSDVIRNNAYVIHTYWYSMENLKCFPLRQYNDIDYSIYLPDAPIDNDFGKCLKNISQELSTLILFTILDKKKNLGEFTINDLKTFIGDITLVNNDLTIKEEFKTAIHNKEQELQNLIDANRDDFAEIKKTLTRMGYSPDNYYCIMQGHTLLDNVASEMVRAVSEPLREEWFRNKLLGTKEQKKQIAEHYAHNTGVNGDCQESLKARIKSMFRDYYGIEQTDAYSVIQRQINRAFASEKMLNIITSLIKHRCRVEN